MRIIAAALFTVFYTSIYSQSIPGLIRYDTINTVLHENEYFTMEATRADVNTYLRKGTIAFAKEVSPGNYVCLSALNDDNKRSQSNFTPDNRWKLAAGFLYPNSGINMLSVRIQDLNEFKHHLKQNNIPCSFIGTHSAAGIYIISIPHTYLNALLACREVTFVDNHKAHATEEASNSFQDISINAVNAVHALYPELNGENMTLSIKEKSVDASDIDLKERVLPSTLASAEVSLHANQMATIIAGGGNTMPSTKGAAWKSNVTSSSFDNLLPDDNAVLQSQGVTIQNHSYGVTIDNQYGAEARAYDVSVNTAPTILHVFSAGNSGAEVSTTGIYSGIAGYANLSGNMKMAKNVLVVSATGKDFAIDARNSSGPAYDGRLKPELVAYGPLGTSDAAAMVSGISALVQQAYREAYKSSPDAAMVKAILIASADDAGSEGIDFKSGYGSVNADKAIRLVKAHALGSDTISPNTTKQFSIQVPAGVKTLHVAVVWNDPAAEAGDATALINDLDSKITFGGKQWLPWGLSHYPHIDSLALPARRREDHLNTTEYITIDNPDAGIYALNITASALRTTEQTVQIAYWLDSANVFRWTYPTGEDAAEATSDLYFRWNTSFTGKTALEVNLDNSGFEIITDTISLEERFYRWTAPDGLHKAMARIKAGGIYYTTDTFTIAPSMPLKIGFNCTDKVMLNWDKVPQAGQYQLLQLGDRYLEPILVTTDTSYIFSKDESASRYYAVAPVIAGKTALAGLTYNYAEQGVNCYYSTFAAWLSETNTSQLSLELSTLYNITSITFEKEQDGTYIPLEERAAGASLTFEYTDTSLQRGANNYRVAIHLQDGNVVYTDVAEIYYSDAQTFTLYPNPVQAMKEEMVLVTDGDDLTIELYDTNGKMAQQEPVYGSFFRFSVSGLAQGLYFYRIYRHAKPVASGRLVVK
ncbi:S8 family peptidase [Ohtaekwangia sp.]|uniref:S8 family peptidase n=1 Tax=Ohtaekwangia sp. TaxID=2066019 RepID=UPI002FDDB82F